MGEHVPSDGVVISQEQDLYALSRHTRRLDTLSTKLGLPAFLNACDATDMQFNMDDDAERPDSATSTNDVMAINGVWLVRVEAERMLDGLHPHIAARHPRFRLLSTQCDEVLAELNDALGFLRSHPTATRFNFDVVG